HRQVGPGRDDAGKMRGAARGGDHHLQPAGARGGRPPHDAAAIPVRRADLQLVRQAEVIENFDAGLHQRKIGFGAEDHGDDWLHYTGSSAISERKKAPSNRTVRAPARAVCLAWATVSPSPTDVTTLPPSVTRPWIGS